MPFSAEISRTNPTCLLFMVDQSSSMDGDFAGQQGRKKSEGVADAINRLLQNLVLKCAKADGIRDYFHVGVIGYGATVEPVLRGTSAAVPLAPISAVANAPIRVEQRKRFIDDGAGGMMEQSFRFPVWFEPVANGKTPMNGAMQLAKSILQGFLKRYPKCFPPLVINLTDGQPTDANPLASAYEIHSLASTDGNVLLFNAHISSQSGLPISFADDEDSLPDVYSKILFRMSSVLPQSMLEAATEEGFVVDAQSRGFLFNADLVSVIRFLEIGTRVARFVR